MSNPMTPEETRNLIAEARREESIHDKLGDGFSEGSEERAFYYEHRDRYKRLADALEARQPSEDDREAIAKALCEGAYRQWNDLDEQERAWHYRDADSVLAAGFSRAAVPDAASEIDRESLVESIAGGTISIPGGFGELSRDDAESIIDAILPAINEWRNTRKTA